MFVLGLALTKAYQPEVAMFCVLFVLLSLQSYVIQLKGAVNSSETTEGFCACSTIEVPSLNHERASEIHW